MIRSGRLENLALASPPKRLIFPWPTLEFQGWVATKLSALSDHRKIFTWRTMLSALPVYASWCQLLPIYCHRREIRKSFQLWEKSCWVQKSLRTSTQIASHRFQISVRPLPSIFRDKKVYIWKVSKFIFKLVLCVQKTSWAIFRSCNGCFIWSAKFVWKFSIVPISRKPYKPCLWAWGQWMHSSG